MRNVEVYSWSVSTEALPVTSQDMLRAIRSLAQAAYRDPPESSG